MAAGWISGLTIDGGMISGPEKKGKPLSVAVRLSVTVYEEGGAVSSGESAVFVAENMALDVCESIKPKQIVGDLEDQAARALRARLAKDAAEEKK